MNRYITRHIILMKLLGIWPYQTKIKKICSMSVLMCVIVTYIIVQVTILKRKWKKNTITSLENAIAALYGLNYNYKYIMLVCKISKINLLYSKFNQMFKNVIKKNEFEILNKIYTKSRLWLSVYKVFMFLGLILWTFSPFVPFILDTIFPLTNGSHSRVIILIDQSFYNRKDTYFAFVGYISITHWIIFCLLIIEVTDFVNIITSICGLCAIICFSYSLSEIFGGNFIIEITMGKIAIGGLCPYILRFKYNLFLFILGSVVLIGTIIHLGFLNYISQKIIDATEQIFHSAYISEFSALKKNEKLMLNIIMLRSLKPCKVIVFHLTHLSLLNYGKLLNTAMSYMTLFISIFWHS